MTIGQRFLVSVAILGLTLNSIAWSAEGTKRPFVLTDQAEIAKISMALPDEAYAKPPKPRRLLIFDLNVNYGGHPSSAYANEAFLLMGEKTRAFQTAISRDPEVFRPESLRQFDAVFFNNNVGNLFTDPELRESLVRFVYRGGGIMGVHGTTVAFTIWPGAKEDWPEFGLMLGGRGANHRDSDEHVFMKLDDPGNPINQVFGGQGWDYRDEFFRVHDTYSRGRVRVLCSIDTAKTDMNQGPPRGNLTRADNDYAVAWIRNYGRGRVFYCTIAHNPYVFHDPRMLKFYLAATQFVLGDLAAPTTPSSRLTPALRAQEKLGWRLGFNSSRIRNGTFYDAIDTAGVKLGLSYIGAAAWQNVAPKMARPFDYRLSNDEMRQVRLKLDSAGVRLLTYAIKEIPADAGQLRRICEFARDMGVEAIISEATPSSPEDARRICDELGLKLATRADSDRSVIALGIGKTENVRRLLAELRKAGVKPVMFAVDDSADLAKTIEAFDATTLELAKD